MYTRKIERIQLGIEPKYITEDSEVRIYLSKMQECRYSKIKRAYKKILDLIIKLFISVTVTIPFGTWAIRHAYIERGYVAYGGEYLFIMLVFFIIYKVLGFKFKGVYIPR